MAPRFVTGLQWVFVILAAIAFGYLAGVRQGQQQTMRMLQTEAAGNLTQRVEALSLLRIGDVSKAVMNLEQEADQLTLGIAGSEGADRRVLLTAKAYRSVVPPPPSREKELAAVFDTVPTPKASECSSALQLLLKTGGASVDKR